MTDPDPTTRPRNAGTLRLRPPTRADLDAVLRWRNDPEVTRWLIRTIVDPDEFVETWLAAIDDPVDHSFVAVRADGAVVGTGSLWIVDATGQTHGDPAEYAGREGGIGYTIDPAHAGNGYASAIAASLLDLAFDDLGLRRVTAGCFADNGASRRVLEKAGMRLEQYAVRDSWHAELGWIDGCTYALLAGERRSEAALG